MFGFVLYEASSVDTDWPDSKRSESGSTLFAQQLVTISKHEYVQLKWDAQYWRGRHQQAVIREQELKEQIEKLQARVRDLRQRLFGRKSEKGAARSEQQIQARSGSKRRRGQQPGSRGHGRTSWAHLPIREEEHDVPEGHKQCPDCGKPLEPLEGTEDSEVLEIEVHAYRRLIRRKRYKPRCDCEVLPGIITAPAPARLIPKGLLGISMWVEILLSKYLYVQPTNRWLKSWATWGLSPSQGTIIGGLKRLAPLFIPVVQAMQGRQLTDGSCHADETGWKVFESIEGKVGYKWFLWVIRSASAVVFVMAPGRGAKVPLEYFAQLLRQTIVVCDRYSAYKKFARIMGVLLAFCWVHLRRDFLTLARSYPELESWAMGWVKHIGTLYHLNEGRLAVRQEPAAFAEGDRKLRAHLQGMATQAQVQLTDQSLHRAARKVLVSLHKHWEGLTVFVEHCQIAMDNNAAETALRNEVMGRKAYYGSGSVWAAELAALLFTILMTLVQVWQINPRRWMHEYLQACAENGHRPPQDLSAFLPWTMRPERLTHLRQPCVAPAGRPATIDTS